MSKITESVEKLLEELAVLIPFKWLPLTAAAKRLFNCCCCWANKILLEFWFIKRAAAAATVLLFNDVVGVTSNCVVLVGCANGDVPVETVEFWSFN